jgi:hypothetical protein
MCQTAFTVIPSPRVFPTLLTRRNSLPRSMAAAASQSLSSVSYPIGNRNRSDVASLTNQIHNCPMLFALLEMIQGQSYGLMPPQSARE